MSQPAFDFGDDVPADFADPTYTVGELATAINEQLRRGFGDGVWVRGEISGLQQRGPHTYFSLVEDDDGGKAVLNVQLFAPTKARLAPMLRKFRLELRNGMKVRIHGHLDFWAQGGRLGLKMASLDPKYTIGAIAQSRDEIMRRLVAEGLLDTNKALSLSPIPLRIGVVTSVGTAAWHDFRTEIEHSGVGFNLTVADTRVQGDLAENMVTKAIHGLGLHGGLDAIVVIRGGGARNELAVFDSEKIARIIAASPVPVLTGLGHEVDRSVADEVAHTALKTPTACAGELIARATQYAADTEQRFAAICRRSSTVLAESGTELSDTAHRIARRTHAAIERSDERLRMRIDRLGRDAPRVLARSTEHLDRAAQRLRARPAALLAQSVQQLDVLGARIGALDPAVQLARGWTITRNADGTIVRRTADVAAGDALATELLDGSITSVVSDVTAAPQPSSTTEQKD
ncbi:MAG: exodeoxyribonuclease VII large subunit [Ilumatobacter sp.]|nr:exodeoxyribonuclease VII large subunit [Ilumatobacter sp.]